MSFCFHSLFLPFPRSRLSCHLLSPGQAEAHSLPFAFAPPHPHPSPPLGRPSLLRSYGSCLLHGCMDGNPIHIVLLSFGSFIFYFIAYSIFFISLPTVSLTNCQLSVMCKGHCFFLLANKTYGLQIQFFVSIETKIRPMYEEFSTNFIKEIQKFD